MAKSLSCPICILGVAAPAGTTRGTPLAPDDASAQESLCLRLRSADANFDPAAGVWTDVSGQGNDAKAAGEIAAWGITYADGTLVRVHDSSGSAFTTSVDNFYRGDLRADNIQVWRITRYSS